MRHISQIISVDSFQSNCCSMQTLQYNIDLMNWKHHAKKHYRTGTRSGEGQMKWIIGTQEILQLIIEKRLLKFEEIIFYMQTLTRHEWKISVEVEVENVERFAYLGSHAIYEIDCSKEICIRIAISTLMQMVLELNKSY